MADISKELRAILTAEYGEEVRGSIHDGIKAVNESAEGSAAAAENAMDEAIISASIAAYQVVLANQASEEAITSASIAAYQVVLAKSWAQGGTGMREGEEENSSKGWCKKSEEYAKGWWGSLLPQGTIEFSELPTEDIKEGYLYNISNAFVTDERFEEGAGYSYPAGTNVYWNKNEHWDCLSGTLTKVLTQAEYDALPEEEKLNGTIYYITDGNNEIPDATDTERGLVIVDAELSEESENPVQNKVVSQALKDLEGVTGTEISQAEYDALPEEKKMNGTVYYIYDKEIPIPSATDKQKGLVIVDIELSEESENPIQNKAVAAVLASLLSGNVITAHDIEAGTDINTLTEYAFYSHMASQSYKNLPTTGNASGLFLMVIKAGCNTGYLQAVTYSSGGFTRVYIRRGEISNETVSWKGWLRIGNFGGTATKDGAIITQNGGGQLVVSDAKLAEWNDIKNYVSEAVSGIAWVNSSNSTYKFVKNGFQWTSNNKGIQSSTAESTWTASVSGEKLFTLKYKVSSEANCDKLTVTLDGTTIVNAVSGDGSEQTYSKMLSAGSHTLVAKFTKDSSVDKYDDCAYLVL